MTSNDDTTDKIKVWKCEECAATIDAACYCFVKNNNKHELPECSHNENWQQTTDYEITERKPEPGHNISKCSCVECHQARDIENLTRERQIDTSASIPTTSPRRRVKIIWSEVTAENVSTANALKKYDGQIFTDENFIGMAHVSEIPPTWLEDVVDGPLNTDQLLSLLNIEYAGMDVIMSDTIEDIVTRTEANQRLRDQPQQAFDDWVQHMYPDWTAQQKAYARIVWNARGGDQSTDEPTQLRSLNHNKPIQGES